MKIIPQVIENTGLKRFCPKCGVKLKKDDVLLTKFKHNALNEISDFAIISLTYCLKCKQFYMSHEHIASVAGKNKHSIKVGSDSIEYEALYFFKIRSNIEFNLVIANDFPYSDDRILNESHPLSEILAACLAGNKNIYNYGGKSYKILSCNYADKYGLHFKRFTVNLPLEDKNANKVVEAIKDKKQIDTAHDEAANKKPDVPMPERVIKSTIKKYERIIPEAVIAAQEREREIIFNEYQHKDKLFTETNQNIINSVAVEILSNDIIQLNVVVKNIYNNTKRNLVIKDIALLLRQENTQIIVKNLLYAICLNTYFYDKENLYLVDSLDFSARISLNYVSSENKIVISHAQGDIDKNNNTDINYTMSDSVIIYIYKGLSNLSCHNDKHDIILKTVSVLTKDEQQRVAITVNYCRNCGVFYIDYNSLVTYKEKFGSKLIEESFTFVQADNSANYSAFNTHSELYKYGYNVRAYDGLSDTERRKILRDLIDKKIMTSADIIRDISNDISRFNKIERYASAVKKWQNDLLFVREYNKGELVADGLLKYKYEYPGETKDISADELKNSDADE